MDCSRANVGPSNSSARWCDFCVRRLFFCSSVVLEKKKEGKILSCECVFFFFLDTWKTSEKEKKKTAHRSTEIHQFGEFSNKVRFFFYMDNLTGHLSDHLSNWIALNWNVLKERKQRSDHEWQESSEWYAVSFFWFQLLVLYYYLFFFLFYSFILSSHLLD